MLRWRNRITDPVKLADKTARRTLLHMSPLKWRLIRAFDSVFKLVLALAPSSKSPRNSNATPESIMVMEYWNLGDLAILVPFLKNLRRSFPHARISLLANPKRAAFLDGQGIVDEIIPVRVPWAQQFNRWKKYSPFSKDWISLLRAVIVLRKRNFTWAFSGRMDVRDNFILWLSGASRRIGYSFAGGGAFLTDSVTPDLTRPHRSDTWLHLLEAVGFLPNHDLCRLQPREGVGEFESFLRERKIPRDAVLFGIHPGARIATRRWGDKQFAQVACQVLNKTDAHILWFSEPGEPATPPRLDRCHAVHVNFRFFLLLLSHCQFLICNDSGPMHLANLLGVPVVAVFGPQSPELFGPRGPRDRVVIRPEFSCRPCFDYCIFEQPYCLKTISPEEVYASVNAVLQQNQIPQPETVFVPSGMGHHGVGAITFANPEKVVP